VQTLAKPLLLASNNEPARLFIGEEVVLTTGASAQTTTGTTGATNTVVTAETERRDIGTTLVIHPRINDDRSVTLTIDQESSERVVGGTSIPLATGRAGDGVVQYPIDTVNTASVQAVAMAQDGLTIAVGGLIKVGKTDADTAVPGLSAVPLFGELFKSKKRVAQRSELVLVITPHVLETAEEAQQASRRLSQPTLEAAAATVGAAARQQTGGDPGTAGQADRAPAK
jgi:general secretion pathway protein D